MRIQIKSMFIYRSNKKKVPLTPKKLKLNFTPGHSCRSPRCSKLINLLSGERFYGGKYPTARDRVIVRRIQEEERTKEGLIIPDTAKEKPQEGQVVAVGPGKQDDGKVISLDVRPGDKVLFGKYSGTEIKLEGEELLILREDDILGIVE